MATANLKINNYILSKILKMFRDINMEVRFHFTNEIQIKAMDESRCHFLLAKMNKNAYKEYKKSEDFEILFNLEIFKQVSEKSTVSEISLAFSDTDIKFKEEAPRGSLFTLKVYSGNQFVFHEPKFQSYKQINTDSTQLLEGMKKLSIISIFFDIQNKDNKILFHSQDAVYGEGVFLIGIEEGFSSDTHYYRLSPLKNILENVPDKTPMLIEIDKQSTLKLTFNFSNVLFTMFIAASIE